MAEAAVSILLGDLTKFIAEENQLLKLKGVKDQFEQAQRVLRQIQAVLKDAGSKQEEDKEIGGWMSDVRDAVYNLEEVFQEFFFEAASKNRENSMKIVLKKLARIPKDDNKIGSRIESFTAKLESLIGRPSTDRGGATSAEREGVRRQTDPNVNTSLYKADTGSDYDNLVSELERNYRDLPFHLQPCFLYLAQFPEDYEILTKRLTQLWMAEGLIPSEGLVPSESEETMEDVSYRLLDEMVERFMVQVGGHGSTRKIKTCRLHRLMRDMCLKKAKEENFLQVQDLPAATSGQAAPINKVRRLSVYLKGEVDELAPTRTESNGHLKSLLYFVQENFYSERSKNLLVSLFKDFKMLRVLKFEDMKAEPEVELPSVVGNLVLLRFLSLKNSEIKRIPSSVANLVFLQTLDIRCAEWVSVEVPNVFGEMSQLRHLYLPLNHRATAKLSLANLSNLQTLVNLSSEDCNLNDILKLTSLRKLVINAPRSTDLTNLGEFMRSKDISFDRHLHSLSLMAGNGTGDIPMEVVSRCPQLRKLCLNGRIKGLQDKFLCSYLTKVTLEQTHLEGYDIERLEKLENLKLLTLRMDAIKSGTMVFSQRGFPSLQFLSLIGLSELKEWKVEKEAMPSLSKLHIEYCWGLKVLPEGLQYISSLKELTIKRMYHEFCSRLGEEGEDFYKIKHVPSVTNLQ